MNLLNKSTIGKFSFHVAFLLVVFIFANIFISSLFFILHISITPIQFVLSVITTILCGGVIYRKHGTKHITGVLVAVALLVGMSIFMTSITYDNTVDAHEYHETAVGSLRYGWNPVYERIEEFNNKNQSPVKLTGTYYYLWDNHYPKAHWIFAANMYSVTDDIQTGRSMLLLVIFALLLLVLHYALIRFNLGLSAVLAVATALNPISVAQIFTYYNDGMMGNLLLMIVLLLTMLLDKKYKKFSRIHYVLIGMAIAIMINLKFTGIVYAGIYCSVYLGYVVFNRDSRRLVRPLLITGGSALVVGILIIGLSTFPKNFIQEGSPLYPLLPKSSEIQFVEKNEPLQFHGMNTLKRMFISNFSESDNIAESTGRDPALKVPFTFDILELTNLSYADLRIGGYGVWFGGALAVSSAWLLLVIIKFVRQRNWKSLILLALPLMPILITILVIAESWWARYLPQMFLIPAVAVVSALLLKRKYIANVLIFILLFNTLITLNVLVSWQRDGNIYSMAEKERVDNFLEGGKKAPILYLNNLNGIAYTYQERYGRVIILSEKPDTKQDYLELASGAILYK